MHVVRRTLLITPLAALFLPRAAFADQALQDALDRMTAYFAAAATMTGATVAGVAQVRPSKFKRAERPKIGAQIDQFYTGLTQLSLAQGVMLGDMGDYIASVRTHGFNEAEHGRMWRGLVTSMLEISSKVQVVYAEQQRATWLRVTLSAQDEMALGDVLRARSSLLSQLSALAPPQTPIEIDKLAALHARYLDLAKKLYELRTALAEARRRFS